MPIQSRYGLIIFLELSIVGILLAVVLHNLEMFELQIIYRNTKTLQTDLQAMLKKIKRNAMSFESKLIHHSLIGVDTNTQMNPILYLFRQKELNEKAIIRQTDA
ncbi:calsyntenin-1 [Dirofilaria immitis]